MIPNLRGLATAINPPDRLPDVIGDPLPSGEIVSAATVGDALNYAADEIERLTALASDRSAEVARLGIDIDRAKKDRARLRAGIDGAREHIDADRIATAYAALGAL